MNKKHYTAIRSLLTGRATKVKRTAVWQEIVGVTGNGIRQGASYELAAEDFAMTLVTFDDNARQTANNPDTPLRYMVKTLIVKNT